MKLLDPGDDLGGPSPPDQIHGGVVAARSELAYLQPDDRATVVVDINERGRNRDEIFAAVQLPRGEMKVGFTKPGFRKELDRGPGANRVGFERPEVSLERHHVSHCDGLP